MTSDSLNVLLILKSVIHNECLPDLVEPVSIKKIFDIASKHNIFPLVYEVYSDLVILNKVDFDDYWLKCASMLADQERRTFYFSRVYRELLNIGVKPIVVKGIFCRSLYGCFASHRPSSDEDIVVSIEDYPKVSSLLLGLGFELKNPIQEENLVNIQEVGFYNKKEKLCIEVHINLFRKNGSFFDGANELFRGALVDGKEWEYKGNMYYLMGITYNFLYVILHSYSHFLKGGVGVRQLLDILICYDKYNNEIDKDELYVLLEKVDGADKFFNDVLNIGSKYLGFKEYGVDNTNSEGLIEYVMQGGAFGNPDAVYRSSIDTVKAVMSSSKSSSTFSVVWNSLFPRKEVLYSQYPELLSNPYKLPFIWVKRYKNFIVKLVNRKVSVKDAIGVSKEKISLLKDYVE